MLGPAIVWVGLGMVGAGDYLRPFAAKVFEQATLDAEGFGDKKGLAREDDGLRVTVATGGAEAGWKTPQGLRIGGDCTITATLVVRKLPKPTGEDGAAIGLAVATQNLDAPDATLLRELEPDGKDVYRSVEKAEGGGGPGQPPMMNRRQMQMMMMNGGMEDPSKPAKPPRHTVPAKGSAIRLQVRREGSTLRYEVFDEGAALPREIAHFEIGPGDLAGVKVFVANRNGTDAVDVLVRDLTIHADRLGGLGTSVRTIFGTVIHGDPTALAGDPIALVVGGPPPTPPAPPAPPAAKPADAPKPADAKPADAKPADAKPVDAAKPAPAAAPASTTTTEVVTTAAAPPAADAPKPPAPAVQAKVAEVAAAAAAPGPGPDGKPAAAPPTPPAPPQPKARVLLGEVETITFERASTLAARYLGQPNVDATMPGGEEAIKEAKKAAADKPKDDKDKEKEKDKEQAKDKKPPVDDLAAPPPGTAVVVKLVKVEPKPNGIRDLHLALAGLREAAIKQVTIQCPTDKGQASWRLDTSDSQDWPIVLARAGMEPFADLFLEPPAGDCKDKEFAITLNYADGQQANAKVKATDKTDPKLAFDPASPTTPLDARVYLTDDEQMFGKLEAITEQALTLTLPWGDKLDVPMARVVGVYMGMPDHKEPSDSFAKRLKNRGDQDLLLARSKDGEVVAIAGVVEAAQGNKLTFLYQNKPRTLPLKGVEGFVLATRPESKPPAEVRPTFDLAGGIVVSGKWATIGAADWQVETPWGQAVKLPAAEVRGVRVRGGAMTYLSDLVPSRVEEIPYFGRAVPYRRDVNLAGGKLKIDKQTIDKGLAVHSRSGLTYDLGKQYATFEALVGFDESAGKKGRVDCRVLADGKEIYANPDLRADAPPVPLSLAVAGVERLQLVVDFGQDEDTGDRVIWGNARVYRRPPSLGPTVVAAPPTPAPATPPAGTASATTPPAGATPAPAATPTPAAAPPAAAVTGTTTVTPTPTSRP